MTFFPSISLSSLVRDTHLMAETSSLCLSRFSPVPSLPHSKKSRSSSSSSSLFALTTRHFSGSRSRPSRLPFHFVTRASDSGNVFGDDDSFGFFPWSQDGGIILYLYSQFFMLYSMHLNLTVDSRDVRTPSRL